MTWTGDPRTTTPQWRATRRRILKRDSHRCTWMDHGERCSQPANQVDHIIPVADGGTDEDTNLRALCTPHHQRKTAIEGNHARWHRNPRTRPPEQHPGLRKGGG